MKSSVTLSEISKALNCHKSNVIRRAKKESWLFEEIAVRGGKKRLCPVDALPNDVREALQKQAINEALPAITREISAPIMLQAREYALTDKQTAERDARLGVKAAILRTKIESACSQEAALHALLVSARSGRLDPVTTRMLRLARDPRGRSGDGFPAIRTLKRWLHADDLTPKKRREDMSVPGWAKEFLSHYQKPQKPSVAEAYEEFIKATRVASPPSIHQVRRFLGKLGAVTRERGRMGPRELRNIRPFVRRDFSLLEPNDIWSGDGHTFDAEVQHPFHGRPFRPEITTFIDVATRRVVGWSVNLAESGVAVADAMRSGMERYGIPAIIYVDNGSGYKNAFMADESVGLMGRLGSTMMHSLPYNSQSRGVIERLHKTLWVKYAKTLPSHIGKQMDKEARQEQFRLTRRALKNGGAMPLIPWDLFVRFCNEHVDEYNAHEHRTLKGISPDLAWRNFEAKGWEPILLSAGELTTLFRPRVCRTLARGEIQLFNNLYFSKELEEFHGAEVHVAYDIHDASRVWVHLPDGRFICEAKCDGNRRHYMPVPVVEQAKQTRAAGRLGRIDAKREEILEELHGGPALAAPAASHVVIGGRVIDMNTLSASAPPPESRPARAVEIIRPSAPRRSERRPEENYAEWLGIDRRIRAGQTVNEADAYWHSSYQKSSEFRVAQKRAAA